MNWTNIRTWNNSQNSAFEELCCQLAAYEKAPAGSKFIRKGAPDAGVECYWRLPTGDEWGWQAKFFLAPPNDSQWGQIDSSLTTAIEKHPRLCRYVICIPVDRQDPKIDKQQWFMDKWDAHVLKWKGWASAKGMTVEFEYWGTHEISQRLALDEHRGRHLFWFGKEFFSDAWYRGRLDAAIANAGVRYTKGLNVELPIAEIFTALGRAKPFFTGIECLFSELKKKWTQVVEERLNREAGQSFDELIMKMGTLLLRLEQAYGAYTEPIAWDTISETANQAQELSWSIVEKLGEVEKVYKARIKGDIKAPNSQAPDYNYAQHKLRQLAEELGNVYNFSINVKAQVCNTPALLVTGEAGTGKTHLLCDAAERHLSAGHPAIMLYGSHFDKSEPWAQILHSLGLNCTLDDFLGAIQSHAEACGGRGIIFIDALNEGDGKTLWKLHLAGMLATLARYPQIGLAISVRTSYLTTITPQELTPARLARIRHDGFFGHEYEATTAFFAHYKIERPAVPLLTPEFGRPLFLKMFCEALHTRGLTKVPDGLSGITSIFNFYLESINEKLSVTLDFDPKDCLVQRAIESLSQLMAEGKVSWLPRHQVKAVVDALLPGRDFLTSLFYALVTEGLLMENLRPGQVPESEVINFSYERFFDHKICDELLKKHVHNDDVAKAFEIQNPLGQLLKDENSAWSNRGFIDAFAIQLPERFGVELPDAAPYMREWQPTRQAVCESFLWRQKKSFFKETIKYINDVLLRYNDSKTSFFHTLLTVSPNPDHPYNARFLHSNLNRQSLPDRDSNWTIFISSEFGNKVSIDRLVEWAWSDEEKTYVSNESALLCAISLTWLLTSPNRFLRDGATKSLVRLLTSRITIVEALVRLFRKVNDPYVWERLLAVAYGCSMRSLDVTAIGKLSTAIFNSVFRSATVAPNVLIRDYARGVIERALILGVKLPFDHKKARPPYKSALLSHIPTEEDLKKYSEYTDKMPDEEWTRVHLCSSVLGMEDFARYVIGSDHISKWRNRRIGEPVTLTAKEIYENFVATLSKKERAALKNYEKSLWSSNFLAKLSDTKLKDIIKGVPLDKKTQSGVKKNNCIVSEARAELYAALSAKNRKLFASAADKYLKNPSKNMDELMLDIKPMQRWIFQRVIDLGWTVERFGKFDRNVNRYHNEGRSGHKAERIGKKYQWIAFYEMCGFMSDNYELRGDILFDNCVSYSGPWQFGYARNIDPSFVLKTTKGVDAEESESTWWAPIKYENWNDHPDHLSWICDTADLPNPQRIMEVQNPSDGSVWLVLNAFSKWKAPTPLGEDEFHRPRKQLWYLTQSYLVKLCDMDKMKKWAPSQNYWGRWMPETHSQYNIFLGEYYWAPAYEFHNTDWHGVHGWTKGDQKGRIPAPILPTTEGYTNEGNGFDCSLTAGINIMLPRKLIAEEMGLCWKGIEGRFFDSDGQLIAYDPSTHETGPGALLIRKDRFTEYLKKKGYAIFWTLLGEKQVVSMSMDWKGNMEISGTYWLDGGTVEGSSSTNIRKPETKQP